VTKAIRAIVQGQVQGVFFRAFTRDEAVQLGVMGWVRNNPDGTVECFAQAPEDKIEAFIRFLHKGSPGARVERVQVRDETPQPHLKEFEIRY
jgi:acylphosphatase